MGVEVLDTCKVGECGEHTVFLESSEALSGHPIGTGGAVSC